MAAQSKDRLGILEHLLDLGMLRVRVQGGGTLRMVLGLP